MIVRPLLVSPPREPYLRASPGDATEPPASSALREEDSSSRAADLSARRRFARAGESARAPARRRGVVLQARTPAVHERELLGPRGAARRRGQEGLRRPEVLRRAGDGRGGRATDEGLW